MDHVIAETQTAPSINSEELDRLVAEADKAKLKAYAPYSKFRVGAALLSSDGMIYPGANVENSSYGLTVCAERCAVFHAASCGARSFRAIVITTDISESTVYPCGACRQVMSEFGNFDVYCLRANGQISRTTLNDLIPYAFSPSDLSKGQGMAEEEEEE
ncbi:Cytidine deaminase [Gracilariopsis chorda]|uniref:Cytidine deaminase n=1 Tax=Gracilariopsis chorda TaxID=448386 RepID=A0A2V3IWR6_9FLOR|nr:Cytidine deaminase [Gracilariopsis chorda]|eukprot:PXF46137.1 Cytidine deaminase [Gracilariopsis chorda]